MKKRYSILAASLYLGTASTLSAAELSVEITNLTQGIYFTPLLLVAHGDENSLFDVGAPASAELQAMAEGGSLDGLAAIGSAISADAVANPAGGLLAPAQSTTAMLSTAESNDVLSIVAMILPSNDGFVGLDNWPIPSEAGTYTLYLNAYDAGTEANDELRGSGMPGMPGMPVPPPLDPLLGMNGTGVTTMSTNTNVHIHPGNLGDSDATGGISDVTNNVHRWLNPVAKVTVTVQ